jgi:hypothetical protein
MKFHRKKRSSREFVKQKKRKQNPEAQIEKKRSEQTTTSTNKKKTEVLYTKKQTVQYHRQYSCLTFIHMRSLCLFW